MSLTSTPPFESPPDIGPPTLTRGCFTHYSPRSFCPDANHPLPAFNRPATRAAAPSRSHHAASPQSANGPTLIFPVAKLSWRSKAPGARWHLLPCHGLAWHPMWPLSTSASESGRREPITAAAPEDRRLLQDAAARYELALGVLSTAAAVRASLLRAMAGETGTSVLDPSGVSFCRRVDAGSFPQGLYGGSGIREVGVGGGHSVVSAGQVEMKAL
jgi:hypothetical protein